MAAVHNRQHANQPGASLSGHVIGHFQLVYNAVRPLEQIWQMTTEKIVASSKASQLPGRYCGEGSTEPSTPRLQLRVSVAQCRRRTRNWERDRKLGHSQAWLALRIRLSTGTCRAITHYRAGSRTQPFRLATLGILLGRVVSEIAEIRPSPPELVR